MVKVGDSFKCDKVSLRDISFTKSFSKGLFKLLDLDPPPVTAYLQRDTDVLVRDSDGKEG